MNLNAISSVNFKNNYKMQEPIEVDFVVEENDNYDGFEKHVDNVQKAKSDVSPFTCIAGVVTAATVLKKGSKAVGWARRAAAGAGEAISTGVVKIFKKGEAADEAVGGIKRFFSKITNDAATDNKKMADGFKNAIDYVFSKKNEAGEYIETKGEDILKKLHDKNIYLNGKSIFDHAVAGAAAVGAMDLVSDKAETSIDNAKIKKSAMENLGEYGSLVTEIATELID